MLDFLAIPLFAFGAIGAALDGSDYSGGRLPPKNTGGPLHWPEAWLLTGIGLVAPWFCSCLPTNKLSLQYFALNVVCGGLYKLPSLL
jgi:hypothetical protein